MLLFSYVSNTILCLDEVCITQVHTHTHVPMLAALLLNMIVIICYW